jgi:hypothetical protein
VKYCTKCGAPGNANAQCIIGKEPTHNFVERGSGNPDTINHPPHYASAIPGIECISVTEHFNFNRGNAIKYIWRAGVKSASTEIEDLKKARWYLDREIARLEKK